MSPWGDIELGQLVDTERREAILRAAQSGISVVPDGADSTARPACHGPQRVVACRLNTAEPAAERGGGNPAASSDEIIVRDDLGPQIPIFAAELEVVETYLGHLLDDLLSSRTAKPDSEKG